MPRKINVFIHRCQQVRITFVSQYIFADYPTSLGKNEQVHILYSLRCIIISMKQSFLMKRLISTEYFLASIVVAIFFVSFAGFDWWWLFIIFPLIDVSAFGYLQNSRIGAATYNIGHSLIGPTILVALYILHGEEWELLVGMAWLFHIFVDRALGYGLKHTEGFHHTHLGTIGKAKKKSRR